MDLLRSAVSNNVQWCSTVCPGDRRTDPANGIWLAAGAPVPLFPDVVTLRADVSPDDISRLTASRASCSVKDSYADVDLGPYGFNELFSARWIGRDGPSPDDRPTGWSRVADPARLEQWCAAARLPQMLPVELLQSGRDRVLAKAVDRRLVAGAIVTNSEDVVGVSNVFQLADDAHRVWAELLTIVGRVFPSLPVVGYERGVALDAALSAAFSDLGPLRVWRR